MTSPYGYKISSVIRLIEHHLPRIDNGESNSSREMTLLNKPI